MVAHAAAGTGKAAANTGSSGLSSTELKPLILTWSVQEDVVVLLLLLPLASRKTVHDVYRHPGLTAAEGSVLFQHPVSA